jgi:hypothetical protein
MAIRNLLQYEILKFATFFLAGGERGAASGARRAGRERAAPF